MDNEPSSIKIGELSYAHAALLKVNAELTNQQVQPAESLDCFNFLRSSIKLPCFKYAYSDKLVSGFVFLTIVFYTQ